MCYMVSRVFRINNALAQPRLDASLRIVLDAVYLCHGVRNVVLRLEPYDCNDCFEHFLPFRIRSKRFFGFLLLYKVFKVIIKDYFLG